MDQQHDFIRSPDFNNLDVYVWGYLKSMVYSADFSDLQDVQQQIENGFAIDDTWSYTLRAATTVQACNICFEPLGGHFEYVL